MSTSDQNGKAPLTRKQLREIRLTGSTPVITEEQAAELTPPPVPPAPVLARAADPAPVAPAPVSDASVDLSASPLTRRQARAQERIRTASVPVIAPTSAEDQDAQPESETSEPELVSAVPSFAPRPAAPVAEEAGEADEAEAEEAEVAEPDTASVSDADDASTDEPAADDAAKADAGESDDDSDVDDEADSETTVADAQSDDDAENDDTPAADAEPDLADLGVDVDAIEDVDDDEEAPRATVNSAFGKSVLADDKPMPTFAPSFDELVGSGDSAGSQHLAPSALIFTPSPGDGSLSGPVASTGEMLITGTYELPEGLGSQGHAKGVTDGKDVDAVLIDGELPPASSPTPIAASSAVSTIKPAGEVIRPPAPEKGNKLMLTLAITAGGLALALAAALIIAFTTNVF